MYLGVVSRGGGYFLDCTVDVKLRLTHKHQSRIGNC